MSESTIHGKCIWYSPKGYGMIRKDNGERCFVHFTSLQNSKDLRDEEEVVFVEKWDDGTQRNVAMNVFVDHEARKSIPIPLQQRTDIKPSNRGNKKVKNTTEFNPDYSRPDMKIFTGTKTKNPIDKSGCDHGVYIIPDLFEDTQISLIDFDNETQEACASFKKWHGDNHWIADDKINSWKDNAPLFNKVIDIVAEYFKMDVKATRLNWYDNSDEWKPFHHDAAAVKEEQAKFQNFTIGISFGSARDICFQHAKTKTRVSIPLQDGCVYAFGKDVNIDWKHGIPATTDVCGARVSIIAWGHSKLFS